MLHKKRSLTLGEDDKILLGMYLLGNGFKPFPTNIPQKMW